MKLKEYLLIKEKEALKLGLEKEAIKTLLIESIYKTINNFIDNLNKEINDSDYDNIINRYLINQEPIQYILGYTYFRDFKVKVTKDVLIPRPETEFVVEKALKIAETKKYHKILDIGTGSGIIAISFARMNYDVYASDVSIKALKIAKDNAILNNVNINFIQSDILKKINGKYDLIVSNPPYIAYEKKHDVDEIVLRNEPTLALFALDNGLYFYKNIIDNLEQVLNDNGTIVFEIGYDQGIDLKNFVQNYHKNMNITIYKDYNNCDRIAVIDFKGEK